MTRGIMINRGDTMRDELLRYFYENKAGRAPDTEQQEQLTLCTIDYLLDNGLSAEEIFGAIDRSCLKDTMVWMPEDLPDDLWVVNLQKKQNRKTGEWYEQQDNLIERDTFYYHPRLRIVSKPPYINRRGQEIMEPFFCEPVIRFTVQDVSNYFFEIRGIDQEIFSEQIHSRTRGVLAGARQRIKFMTPVDYVLFLIDMTPSLTIQSLDSDNEVLNVISYLKGMVANAHAEGKDKITWRHQRWLG